MKNWTRWLEASIVIGLLCYLFARQIVRGKLSAPEAACVLVMAFLTGGLVVNRFRDRALHYALLALYGVTFAVFLWFEHRTLYSPGIWSLLALSWGASSWQLWKTQKSKSNPATEPR